MENLGEFEEAQVAGADNIMLDNFSIEDIKSAVNKRNENCKLEISGGVSETSLLEYKETGADFVSIGALTKHVKALDLSFRIVETL